MNLAKLIFGRDPDGSQCVACGSKQISHDDFLDDLSRKEFRISSLCQSCQTDAFSCEDDEDEL